MRLVLLRLPARVPARGTLLLTAVLAVLSAGMVLLAPAPSYAATSCLFAAHRGDTSHATENSLRAFQAAITHGADYLEMDVQVTRTGDFRLMHDETVDRTSNGHGRLIDMTRAQADALRLDDGQSIPSLRQVLDLAKPTGVKILLEMKWIPSSRFARLHAMVDELGSDRVVVHSFSRYVVGHYRAAYPGATTGLDVSRPISVRDARSFGGVLPDYRYVSDTWITALRTGGVPAYLSTPDSADAWRRFKGRVTLLVTNRVVDYAAWRTKNC